MKILNFIKRNIIGFIVGAIVFGSIGVYAVTVASSDVTYNNTNVQAAINDLYSRVSGSGGNIITIYSAAEDILYYYDGSKKIEFCNTDLNGKGLCSVPTNGSITLYSSIAKNPTNLSNPYSKTVNITSSTTEIKLMPAKTLYWYGYKAYTEWHNAVRGGYDFITFNTNNINMVSSYAEYGHQGCFLTWDRPLTSNDTTLNMIYNEPNQAGKFLGTAPTSTSGYENDYAEYTYSQIPNDTLWTYPLGSKHVGRYPSVYGWSTMNFTIKAMYLE